MFPLAITRIIPTSGRANSQMGSQWRINPLFLFFFFFSGISRRSSRFSTARYTFLNYLPVSRVISLYETYPFEIRDEHVVFLADVSLSFIRKGCSLIPRIQPTKINLRIKVENKSQTWMHLQCSIYTVRPVDSIFLFTEGNQNFLPCKMKISYFAQISFRIFLM